MKIFDLGVGYTIVCRSENTRYGFRHLAVLVKDGYKEIDTAKICYYNRTWESYEFESVKNKLLAQNPELNLRLKEIEVLEK